MSWTRRTFALAVLGVCLPACSTLQGLAALRGVDFMLDRVTGARLAGVDLSGISRASDLSLGDGTRVGAAIASRNLPLSFRVHVLAENPSGNPVAARLTQMDWTLVIDDTETISGRVAREFVLEPGEPTDIPIDVTLDLFDFYERSAADLIELALNVAGAGGEPQEVRLTAVPTIRTPLGAITYPRPIRIAAVG